ncbi:hypothetical protein AWH48_03715 [Domibacillus aminovorans]|uniref:NodB homology domain-containing protein n=1 Tax=Domibacillus aminovorans TaxID=29332 RepID=A0A177KQZ8_9BACI|nr:polysaccharide deacetylase family protein [Domibacillus aminovorans]OAH55792.1 hypothetical protein AWH48_03715 [Domibacillus aminovorans]
MNEREKKKRIFGAIASLCIAGFFMMETQASADQVKLHETMPVYETINNQHVWIGALMKGGVYAAANGTREVEFGNSKVTISLDGGTVTASSVPTETEAEDTIITKKQQVIFNSIGTDREPMAILNRNVRFPVTGKTGAWYTVNVGGQEGYIHQQSVEEDNGIPVLMYHHMVENPENTVFYNNSMVIKVAEFQKQMDYLKQKGYRTITLQELESYLRHEKNMVGKAVVITFDDGNMSTLKYAYPILKEYGMKATQFLIGGHLNQKSRPWDENTLQYVGFDEAAVTGDVYDYQNHTLGMHLREPVGGLPYLQTKTYEEIKNDFLAAGERIGRIYDGDSAHIKYLAYPWGQFSPQAIQAARDTGITMAFTTETGNVKLGDDLYLLKRQGVAPRHTIEDFAAKLEGVY